MRQELLKALNASLEEIRHLQNHHKRRVEELEREEDMTLLAIKELEKSKEEDAE